MARASLKPVVMLATAITLALLGLTPQQVRVEVHSGRGTASFEVVGLPETTVRESRVRVRAALAAIGVPLHSHCITVNLAPADLRKFGSAFDLAIAVATLAAVDALAPELLAGTVFLGELSLGGELHPIRGVLPRLRGAAAAGARRAIVPIGNGAEAAVLAAAEGLEVFVARDLASVVEHLRGSEPLAHARATQVDRPEDPLLDLAEVRGQPSGRRALEIAAAGGHDLLLLGPPGAGKTMLARTMPGLLPPLADDEALEVTAIHSVAGTLAEGRGLLRTRPFRAPHHTVSDAGLLGGGDPPRPGELSLAHGGVLFLDELPEFRRPAIEGLRQPLEEGVIRIARAKSVAVFPARPTVVAAMNPCPCGWFGSGSRICICTPDRVRNYRGRVSGPIVDRFDVHVQIGAVDADALSALDVEGEPSATVRARVLAVREAQAERHRRGETKTSLNARLSQRDLARVARPDATGRATLRKSLDKQMLSARAYTKILRLARTLADMAGSTAVLSAHVHEALTFRVLDRPPDALAA